MFGLFGKAPAPPPPPEPTSMDSFLAITADYPNLTTALLVAFNLYLLLSLAAAAKNSKPGKGAPKVPASDVVVYKKGDAVSFTDPKAESVVRVAKTGIASLEPSTLCKLFQAAATNFPEAPALKVQRNGQNGPWETWTWKAYYDKSMACAASLLNPKIGFQPHDCVNIIGFNSPEWFVAQMGAILCGGKAAGVYTTNEPAACKYQASHSEAKVIFVEDQKQLHKYTFRITALGHVSPTT